MQVHTENIKKTYGQTVALNDTTFTVEDGEFVTLLGPSGCGKTTFLRTIAGFIQPDHGRVFVGGTDITDLAPHKRGIGMVFQNFALFPHMTVAKNIGYGLKMRGEKKETIRKKVEECLEMVGLSGFEDRYPHQLSGGQQQRIAIARVLAIEPKLMLLDEPFGALDKKLRVQLQVELKKLISRLHVTAMFVTHDQEEALIMSDRIAVMEKGNIVQYASPVEIYDHPKTEFVATFIGNSNMFNGEVKHAEGEEIRIAVSQLEEITCDNLGGLAAGDKVRVMIRPENFSVLPQTAQTEKAMTGKVVFVVHLGSFSEYEIRLENDRIIRANVQRAGGLSSYQLGDIVKVSLVNEQACAVYRA